jgi:hypothetical protein
VKRRRQSREKSSPESWPVIRMQSVSTQQWHEEGSGVAAGPAEIVMTNESAAEAPSPQDMLTEPEQTLYVSPAYLTIGNFVDVAPRTWPGINQLGGVGCITKTHEVDVKRGNETAKKVVKINVKYTLGGRESNVDVCYVTEYVHGEKLRDRSKQLGRCTRCGSHREDCNSCDWVAEQQQQQQEEALTEDLVAEEHDDVSNTFMDSDEEERARLDISRKYKSLRRQRNKRRRKSKAVATTDKVQLDDEDIPLAVLEKQKEKQQKAKKPKQKRRRTAQTSVLASLPETAAAAAKDETDEFEFPGTPTVGSPFSQEEERLLTPRPLDEDGNVLEEEKLLTPRPLDDDGNDIEEERLLTPRPLEEDETELSTPKTLNEDASMNFDGNDEISFHGDQDDSSDEDIALNELAPTRKSTYEPESSDDSILSYESYETESDDETYDGNVVSQQLHQIPREFEDLLKFIDEVASEVSDNRLSYANQKLVLLKSRLIVAKNTRNTSLHAMNTAERVEIDLLAADR